MEDGIPTWTVTIEPGPDNTVDMSYSRIDEGECHVSSIRLRDNQNLPVMEALQRLGVPFERE